MYKQFEKYIKKHIKLECPNEFYLAMLTDKHESIMDMLYEYDIEQNEKRPYLSPIQYTLLGHILYIPDIMSMDNIFDEYIKEYYPNYDLTNRSCYHKMIQIYGQAIADEYKTTRQFKYSIDFSDYCVAMWYLFKELYS